jgi:hypothetical protein
MKPSDGVWIPDKMWVLGGGAYTGYARNTARHGWIARLMVRETGAQLAWAKDFDDAEHAHAWLEYQVKRQAKQQEATE